MGNTFVHVLINTARKIVEWEKSLGILEHASQGREQAFFLPSWVPDWTSPEVDCGLKKYVSSSHTNDAVRPFNASKEERAVVMFWQDRADETNLDLRVKGIFFDTLDEIREPLTGFPGLLSFLTLETQYHVIVPNTARMEDEIWVLYGASMPVVLRPEFKNSYGFLGQAVVLKQDGSISDIMMGRAIELAEQESVETREIWLI
jgi:hypothetical protein